MQNLALFLLVEDDPDDVLLMRRAFAKAKITNPLQVVPSGQEAIEYLSGAGRFSDRSEFPLPNVVLLDLIMPGMDGVEVLQWIRAQPDLATLRVVVLTNAQAPRDIERAYKAGANSFLVKPSDFDRFVELSQAFSGYWVWLNHPPPSPTLMPAILSEATAPARPCSPRSG